nr:F0F1 ATP synthase subunit A [Candidatus Karelsulcia muelleri]
MDYKITFSSKRIFIQEVIFFFMRLANSIIIMLFKYKKKICFLFIFFFLVSNLTCLHSQKLNSNKTFNPAFFIKSHINDSHEWHFKKNVYISLPIILFDKGFKLFMSSKFDHGNNLVNINNNYYRLINNQIYKTNKFGFLKLDSNGKILNNLPLDFSITKNVLTLIISIFILCLIFIKLSLSYKEKKPNYKTGLLLESIFFYIKNEIAIPNLGIKNSKLYFPFFLTLFFFILINNFIGLLPIGPNITGNISVTLSLSMIIFFIIIFSAKKKYWKHIFWMPKVPLIIKLLLIPIEIFGIFLRPLTLCIRLFANITAGHIILISFLSLIFIFKNIYSIIISIPFSIFIFLLEIMVGFLQAFIFTSLSALFLGIAIKD